LKFVGVDPCESKFGAGLFWRFEVVNGENAGRMVGTTTNTKATPKNNCGKLIEGLTGKGLQDGKLNTKALVGHEYQGFVKQGYVNAVMPLA